MKPSTASELLPQLTLTPNVHRGALLAISGMDCTGKSTFLNQLRTRLQASGRTVVVTRQPSALIREWSRFKQVLAGEECFDARLTGGLVGWDRLNTQLAQVLPALKRGHVVLCERYTCDITVYSSFRGAEARWVQFWVAPLLEATTTFVTDAPLETVLERFRSRGSSRHAHESQSSTIDELLRLYRIAAEHYRYALIDTSSPPESQERVVSRVLSEIGLG